MRVRRRVQLGQRRARRRQLHAPPPTAPGAGARGRRGHRALLPPAFPDTLAGVGLLPAVRAAAAGPARRRDGVGLDLELEVRDDARAPAGLDRTRARPASRRNRRGGSRRGSAAGPTPPPVFAPALADSGLVVSNPTAAERRRRPRRADPSVPRPLRARERRRSGAELVIPTIPRVPPSRSKKVTHAPGLRDNGEVSVTDSRVTGLTAEKCLHRGYRKTVRSELEGIRDAPRRFDSAVTRTLEERLPWTPPMTTTGAAKEPTKRERRPPCRALVVVPGYAVLTLSRTAQSDLRGRQLSNFARSFVPLISSVVAAAPTSRSANPVNYVTRTSATVLVEPRQDQVPGHAVAAMPSL